MIRPAHPDDAPQITALWNWMIRETLATFTTVDKTTVDIQQMIFARDGGFFVAEQNGRISGFVTFGPFREGPGYAGTVEHTVIVRAEAQGASVGRMLLKAAEAAAATRGLHVMVAAISSANPAATAFHEAMGYERVALMPQVGRKQGRWLDLILMQKILSRTD